MKPRTFAVSILLSLPLIHYGALAYTDGYHALKRAVPILIADAIRSLNFKLADPSIDRLIDLEADRHGIPREILHAIATTESNKNLGAVSPKGAIGVFQIMPPNYKRCGLPSPASLYDPENNIRCGAQILSEELRAYPLPDALRIYNGGPRALKRQFAESENYVLRVLSKAASN